MRLAGGVSTLFILCDVIIDWPLNRAYSLLSKFSWTKLSQMAANLQKLQTLHEIHSI